MSTKASIFLTKDNEHCYLETAMQHHEGDQFKGFTIVLELDKRNARLVLNDDNDIVIEIDPGSELYEQLNQLKDVKRKKATIEVYEPVISTPTTNMPHVSDRVKSAFKQLADNLNKQIAKNIESQIVDRLSLLGYEFKNNAELAAFAKERLTLTLVRCTVGYSYESFLYLDKDLPTEKLIASWNNNAKVDFTDNGIEVKYNV